jgi:hypothetical protein
MVTEILAIAFKNELDIGDITGIGALIATAITFFLTYRHGTQSEQTRIAKETWEKFQRIIINSMKYLGSIKKKNISNDGSRYVAGLEDIKKELDRRCEILLDHVEYYAFLVYNKQIKGKFTSYYTKRVLVVYELIKKTYEELFQTQDLPTQPIQPSTELHPEIYTSLLGRYKRDMKPDTDILRREIRRTERRFPLILMRDYI